MTDQNQVPDRQNQDPESKEPESPQGENLPSEPQASETDSLKARIAELEASLGQITDQLLRKAAEFENYKKRTESEYVERARFAKEEILLELLPVVDDFERSLKQGKDRKGSEVFYRGVELIYQKLIGILEAQGLKHYEVLGKTFDAYYHDALMQMPRPNVPPDTVIEEIEKGYMLYDKVLRHAKVIVADDNHSPGAQSPDSDAHEQAGETNEDQAP